MIQNGQMNQQEQEMLMLKLQKKQLKLFMHMASKLHFMELRQDAWCSMPTDSCRHEEDFGSQIKQAKTPEEKVNAEKALDKFRKNKRAALQRGTCWAWLCK